MGIYASYLDAQGYGGPDEHEPCLNCNDSGYIAYPVTVMPEVTEHDACPYGCVESEENDDPQPAVQTQAWWPSRFQQTTSAYGMPYEEQRRRHRKATSQLVGAWGVRRLRPAGRITTDVPVEGYINGIDCTVPAFLPGTPVEEGLWTLTVSYEYLGSTIQVEYLGASKALFRFAYGFEEGYSTSEVLV